MIADRGEEECAIEAGEGSDLKVPGVGGWSECGLVVVIEVVVIG